MHHSYRKQPLEATPVNIRPHGLEDGFVEEVPWSEQQVKQECCVGRRTAAADDVAMKKWKNGVAARRGAARRNFLSKTVWPSRVVAAQSSRGA